MNPLLETIMGAAGGGVLQQVAGQFGLNESQAQSAISALLPALTGGVQQNVSQEGGLESLLGALTGGNHQQYLDDPSTLSGATQDGNSILGHLLGSKDVSRQVAAQAAEQTGIGSDVLKQMLPIVASLAMGALAKQSTSNNLAGMLQGGQSSGVMGMLGSFLDQNKDGSMVDDVLKGVAGKLFGGR
ncbi:MAG: DUF937 domain-containing protein [Bryobacteraceae bacterium]|nr:DUF937 domain-containing protein [Bryobacteraceae bacterium]